MNEHFTPDAPKWAIYAFNAFLIAGLAAPLIIIGGYLV